MIQWPYSRYGNSKETLSPFTPTYFHTWFPIQLWETQSFIQIFTDALWYNELCLIEKQYQTKGFQFTVKNFFYLGVEGGVILGYWRVGACRLVGYYKSMQNKYFCHTYASSVVNIYGCPFLKASDSYHLIPLDSTMTSPPPVNSYSASHGNWCTATLWNRIMTAQCEGMGEVGSARYEPALLPPCPSIRVLSYSNCQRSTHSSRRAWQCKCY